jgi:hypothetical protein
VWRSLFFNKRFAHNLPIFLIGKFWLNIAICQTLEFSILKMSLQEVVFRKPQCFSLQRNQGYIVYETSLDRNNTPLYFFDVSYTIYPDFLVAEYYGLRNRHLLVVYGTCLRKPLLEFNNNNNNKTISFLLFHLALRNRVQTLLISMVQTDSKFSYVKLHPDIEQIFS